MPSVLNCNTLSMQVPCPPKTSFLFSEWIHGTKCCWQEKPQPGTLQSAGTQQFSEFTLQTENTSSLSKKTQHQGKKEKGRTRIRRK